jgi:hypothetical protein
MGRASVACGYRSRFARDLRLDAAIIRAVQISGLCAAIHRSVASE